MKMSHVDGRAFEIEGRTAAKAQRQEWAWCVSGVMRRAMWLEWNEQGTEQLEMR